MSASIHLTTSLAELDDAIAELNSQLGTETALPAWVDGVSDSEIARFRIREIYGRLDFEDAQQGNTTVGLTGVIGASESLIEAAYRVNRAKKAFRAAWVAMADMMIEIAALNGGDHPGRLVSLREHHLSNNLGRSRLSVLQAWRSIPIADAVMAIPHRIGMSLSQVPKVERVTRAEALERLLRLGDDFGIQAQRDKLMAIPEDEPLAIVKRSPPHIRANVAWRVDGQWVRKQYPATLPLMFLAQPGVALPLIGVPKTHRVPNTQRPRRLDAKVEPEAFLPAIHAHRYHRF